MSTMFILILSIYFVCINIYLLNACEVTCNVDNLQYNTKSNSIVTLTSRKHQKLQFEGLYMKHKYWQLLCEDAVYCIHSNYLCTLEYLFIKSCNIRIIEPRAFRYLPDLKELVLSKNQIAQIKSKTFLTLDNLQYLNLAYNEIQIIEGKTFYNLESLKKINLSFNKIRKIEDWFKNTPNLQKIDLSGNSIREIPKDAFKNIAREAKYDVTIKLDQNKIKYIHPRAFDRFKRLTSLFLAQNLLKIVDIRFIPKDSGIRFLDLTGNEISCLQKEDATKWSYLNLIVQDNPISCECVDNMKQWGYVFYPFQDLPCE